MGTHVDQHHRTRTTADVHHGHDGVRRLGAILRSYMAEGDYEYHTTLTDGDLGMLVWSGRCARADDHVHDGVDSYVIRDGRIVAQTIHYSSASNDG